MDNVVACYLTTWWPAALRRIALNTSVMHYRDEALAIATMYGDHTPEAESLFLPNPVTAV